MDEKDFTTLAVRTQAGEAGARRSLLETAYSAVSFQCRLILRSTEESEKITAEIMEMLNNELDSLDNPANFQKWMQKLIASKCSHALAYLRWYTWAADDSAAGTSKMTLNSKLVDEAETALYVTSLVEQLPDDERLCAVLYSCGEMALQDIARHTDFSEDTVRIQLNLAKDAIQSQLNQRKADGYTFIALGTMPIMLCTTMDGSQDKERAKQAVEKLLNPFDTVPESEPAQAEKKSKKKSSKAKNNKMKRRKKKANWLSRIFLTFVVLCALAAIALFGWIAVQEFIL